MKFHPRADLKGSQTPGAEEAPEAVGTPGGGPRTPSKEAWGTLGTAFQSTGVLERVPPQKWWQQESCEREEGRRAGEPAWESE